MARIGRASCVRKLDSECYGRGMEYRDLEHELCSIARPISVLGERWTLIVLRQAFMGARRAGPGKRAASASG